MGRLARVHKGGQGGHHDNSFKREQQQHSYLCTYAVQRRIGVDFGEQGVAFDGGRNEENGVYELRYEFELELDFKRSDKGGDPSSAEWALLPVHVLWRKG